MVKLVDTLDLKSSEQQCSCGFKSRSEYSKAPFKGLFLFWDVIYGLVNGNQLIDTSLFVIDTVQFHKHCCVTLLECN